MNPTDSVKNKKKYVSKTKSPMKKNKKNVDQFKLANENEEKSGKLEEREINNSVEEKVRSDVIEKVVEEGESKLKTAENEQEDFVKSDEEVSNETAPAPSLIEMLNHRNEKVRIEAIESLLNIGDKSVSYAFASCMKDDSFQVRLGALRGLYKYGGDLAADYLITALEDEHPDVRRRALIYLGWLRKKELVPYITGALADKSSLVRKIATYTLGDLKDFLAIPHLIKVLDDKDEDVKKGALAALKRVTGKSFPSEKNSPEEINKEKIDKWKEWWSNENQEKS